MTFQDELAIGYLGFFIIVLLGACESGPKFNFHHYIEDDGKRVLSTEGVLDDAGVPNGNFNIYISGDELWSGNYQRGVKAGLWQYTNDRASRSDTWVAVETGAMLFSLPNVCPHDCRT